MRRISYRKMVCFAVCFFMLMNLLPKESLVRAEVLKGTWEISDPNSEIPADALYKEGLEEAEEPVKGYFETFDEYLESLKDYKELLKEEFEEHYEEHYEEYYEEYYESYDEFLDDVLYDLEDEDSIKSFKEYFEYYEEEWRSFRDYYKESDGYFMVNVPTEEFELTAMNGDVISMDNKDVFNKPVPNCTGFDMGVIISGCFDGEGTVPTGEWGIVLEDVDGNRHDFGTMDMKPGVYNEMHLEFDPMTVASIDLIPPYYSSDDTSFIFLPMVKNILVADVKATEAFNGDETTYSSFINEREVGVDFVIKEDDTYNLYEEGYTLYTNDPRYKENPSELLEIWGMEYRPDIIYKDV